jgi:cytochrome P450
MAFSESAPAHVTGASSPSGAAAGAFDLNDLRSSFTGVAKLMESLLGNQRLFSLVRRFWPIFTLPGTDMVMVTRFDDVQEVMGNDSIFPVPWGDKVKELDGGPNFVLGMQDGAEYRRYQKQVMRVFTRDDVNTIVAPLAARLSEDIINRSGGRLDAVQDLITRVPTLICKHYYGVPIAPEQEVDFGHWTIAMSTFMFADPTNNPALRRVGLAAGALMRPLIDQAIAEAKVKPTPGTLLARMIDLQRSGDGGFTDEIIRAILIGMISGFVPTNTMAASNVLEMLFDRPDFMGPTRAAALAGDDDLLRRCLIEAMRFRPLNPGPFRVCVKDYTIAEGSLRAKKVRAGTPILAGTLSAMFDDRQIKDPFKFDPNRPASDYMVFGSGLHWCVGHFIAMAQVMATFKALLAKNGLRRAKGKDGQMQLLGPFPEHLIVEFDP